MPRKQQDNPQQLSLDLSDWLATPPAEPPSAPSPVSSRFALAQALSEMLLGGEELSARRLAMAASDVFGGTQAEGKWLGKDAYDAMEVAVNLYLRDNKEAAAWTALDAHGAAEKVQALTALVQRLPTQTRRDEEMDELQQFSTPPALAFVANWVANVSAEDIVLEPSAGTGDLAIWSQLAGADLVLNELSERRRALLADLFPDAALTGENAEQRPGGHDDQWIENEQAETPVRAHDADNYPVEQRGQQRAVHMQDFPPGRAREVLADDVLPAQEHVTRLHLPVVADGGRIPGRDEAFGVVLGAADLAAQAVEIAGATVFAPEHAVVFGQPSRVVALYINHKPALDLHEALNPRRAVHCRSVCRWRRGGSSPRVLPPGAKVPRSAS